MIFLKFIITKNSHKYRMTLPQRDKTHAQTYTHMSRVRFQWSLHTQPPHTHTHFQLPVSDISCVLHFDRTTDFISTIAIVFFCQNTHSDIRNHKRFESPMQLAYLSMQERGIQAPTQSIERERGEREREERKKDQCFGSYTSPKLPYILRKISLTSGITKGSGEWQHEVPELLMQERAICTGTTSRLITHL